MRSTKWIRLRFIYALFGVTSSCTNDVLIIDRFKQSHTSLTLKFILGCRNYYSPVLFLRCWTDIICMKKRLSRDEAAELTDWDPSTTHA